MNIAAIICELNPAHQGHKYIFDMAKKETNSDYIIAIMSGNYVQRGEPAIFNKYARTKMALDIGADLVIELPGLFATGSVEYFSRGAISLIDKLNCINYLVFGSESANIDLIKNTQANMPNDILASGYLKATDYFNSKLIPVAIKRLGDGYNETNFSKNGYPSALSIRNLLYSNNFINLEDISKINISYPNDKPVHINDFSVLLINKLLEYENEGYDIFFDVYSDLSNKIKQNINSFESITKFCDILKSKDIAYAHLKRALLHIILDYTKSDFELIRSDYFAYCRILGFKQDSAQLLKTIKEKSMVPIISKLADSQSIITEKSKSILNKDINASHLYSYISKSKINNEYQQKIVIQ